MFCKYLNSLFWKSIGKSCWVFIVQGNCKMHILSKNIAVGLYIFHIWADDLSRKKPTNFILRILIPLGELVTPWNICYITWILPSLADTSTRLLKYLPKAKSGEDVDGIPSTPGLKVKHIREWGHRTKATVTRSLMQKSFYFLWLLFNMA